MRPGCNREPIGRWCLWNRRCTALLALVAGITLAAVPSVRTVEAQETPREGVTVRMTAQVRDPVSEEMVPGAVIELVGVDGRYVTDADGRAVIDLPLGRYWVSVRRWGYDRLAGYLDVIRSGELTFGMYKTRDIDLEAPGALLVRVVHGESGDPIEGALVSLAGGESRVSDRSGLVAFRDLREPVVRFSVELTGYGERVAPVALSPDRTTVARVQMMVETAAPRPVETEMRSLHMAGNAIHDNLNRYGKRTYVVTRPMLDQLAAAQLTDVFRTVPSIRVEGLATATPDLHLRQCSNHLSLYVDGTRRRTLGDAQRRFLIDDIPVESVELIEIWEGRRNRSCRGWALIWTQRRVR